MGYEAAGLSELVLDIIDSFQALRRLFQVLIDINHGAVVGNPHYKVTPATAGSWFVKFDVPQIVPIHTTIHYSGAPSQAAHFLFSDCYRERIVLG